MFHGINLSGNLFFSKIRVGYSDLYRLWTGVAGSFEASGPKGGNMKDPKDIALGFCIGWIIVYIIADNPEALVASAVFGAAGLIIQYLDNRRDDETHSQK